MARSRYKSFFSEELKLTKIPFIKIPTLSTDYYVYYEVGKTRLDRLSYEYYGNANYGWLILQANPEVGALEYLIPNNTLLRIPYPLSSAIQSYENGISNFDTYYGLEN